MSHVEPIRTRSIAGNTLALFLRQAVVLCLSLLSIRILLQTLGVEDYAIYSVVYNLILMSSFLWGTIQTLTQRFFAYALGAGDMDRSRASFDTGLVICVAAALVTWATLETLGIWFVSEKMQVAPDRLEAAIVMFRAYFVFAVLKLFSTFFVSVIVAHEDMGLFARVSILEAVLRLSAAFALALSPFDPLMTFGVLFSLIEGVVFVIFAALVFRKYPECGLRWPRLDRVLLADMARFSGWTIFGQLSTISRNQAITLLINQAFNPATVAARALSVSVGAQVLMFANNVSTALVPPITKSWASGRREEMYRLIFLGSKVAFFLVWVATLPIIAVLPGILDLWLGRYPPETVLFIRLALLENAIVALSLPLMAAVRAVGDMRAYELILGLMQFTVLILSGALIFFGASAASVYLVAIGVNLAMFWVRLEITGRKTGLPVAAFLRAVLVPVGLVVGLSAALTFGVLQWAPGVVHLRLDATSLSGLVMIAVCPVIFAFAFGLTFDQKRAVLDLVARKFTTRASV